MVGGNAFPEWAQTWSEGRMVPCSGDSAHGHPLELKLEVQVGEEHKTERIWLESQGDWTSFSGFRNDYIP